MNFAVNKEKGTKAPIEYVCTECAFTTFNQQEEQAHYTSGHFLRSIIRDDLQEKL